MGLLRFIVRRLEELLYLAFPHLCLACRQRQPPRGEDICVHCKATLPESGFHLRQDNPFTERFWGKVKIESGAALYLFTKESRVQHLIHELKYKGQKQVGEILGRRFGYALKDSPFFKDVELIVPVPLHPKKELIRGYNQSEMFANGLSETLKIPVLADGLKRVEHSESQTKKGRKERSENVREVFAVKRHQKLEGKHILIVDDVLTTGSTLETCARKVLEVPGTRVSLATIAIAMH